MLVHVKHHHGLLQLPEGRGVSPYPAEGRERSGVGHSIELEHPREYGEIVVSDCCCLYDIVCPIFLVSRDCAAIRMVHDTYLLSGHQEIQ